MTGASGGPTLAFTYRAAVDPAVCSELETVTRAFYIVVSEQGLSDLLPRRVEIVVTDAFEQAVRTQQAATGPTLEGEPTFELERPGGGHVAAKTMPRDEAYDDVVILFDASFWPSVADPSGAWRAVAISLLCHELTHPLLRRLDDRSAVDRRSLRGSIRPEHIAHRLARELNHEYRADRMSEVWVSQLLSRDEGGRRVPLRTWDITGEAYLHGLQDALFEAYAELPGRVQDYRVGKIGLTEMYGEVQSRSEAVLTSLVHAQAHADAVGAGSLLAHPRVAPLAFARLYLADTVPALCDAIRVEPFLPTADQWREIDARVLAAGEVALLEVWRRLGLTFANLPSAKEFRIDVGAPQVTDKPHHPADVRARS